MKAVKFALLGLAGVIGMLVSMFGPVKIPFAEALAKTYYRYALGALLIILLLIPVAVGLFLLAFDANNFKSEIIQFVKERTQRDLVLQGDIKVTFFPKLGLDSGKLSLSQRNSAREFASISNARLYIAWLPLLKRQLVFDHVVIDGIHANVIRLKDGSTNFDDLLISDEHLAPLTFDIDSVRITDSSINWQDELEEQRVSLHDLKLDTGRLADATPSNLTANFRLDSEKAHISTKVQLKSRLFFDRKTGRYEFADLEGKLEGDAGPVDHLAVDFRASLDSYPAQRTLTTEELVISATGKYGQRDLAFHLAIPVLKISSNTYSGSQLALDANLSHSNEISTVTLLLPAFEAANRIFNTEQLNAEFDFKRGEGSLHGVLNSPLSINLEPAAPKIKLGDFTLVLTGNHPLLSGEITANTTGNLQLDYGAQNAKLSLVAKLDQSRIMANLALNDFLHPAYSVEVNANRLDLDHYLASDWSAHILNDSMTFDSAGLKDMMLHGTLRVGELKADKFKLSKLAADIKIDKAMLTISPLTAHLYGGALTGSVSVTANETPVISVKQNLRGVQMGALLADKDKPDRLVGKGSLDLDIRAQGNSVGVLRKDLNGNASLSVSNGSLAGINLRKALVDGKNELGSGSVAQIHPANFTSRTDFSELVATFNFKNGVISNSIFKMKSPLIQTTGEGKIDTASGSLDYKLATIVSSSVNLRTAGELLALKGVTVPIRVSGRYSEPDIALDFGAASGGNVAKLIAARAAKAAAEIAVATTTVKQNNTNPSAPTKSRKAAGKPVKKSHP